MSKPYVSPMHRPSCLYFVTWDGDVDSSFGIFTEYGKAMERARNYSKLHCSVLTYELKSERRPQ